MFKIRSEYSQTILTIVPNQITPELALLLGEMMANKTRYGVVYDQEIENLINTLNDLILKSQ